MGQQKCIYYLIGITGQNVGLYGMIYLCLIISLHINAYKVISFFYSFLLLALENYKVGTKNGLGFSKVPTFFCCLSTIP